MAPDRWRRAWRKLRRTCRARRPGDRHLPFRTGVERISLANVLHEAVETAVLLQQMTTDFVHLRDNRIIALVSRIVCVSTLPVGSSGGVAPTSFS
jgi:hypothetical protein